MKKDHVIANIRTISGNLDIDEKIFQKLPEHDFINLYNSYPNLKVFQNDYFWKRRLESRHGEVPKPKHTTWRQLSLRLGWYNWCISDWFILGLTENIKKELTETAKEVLSRNSRTWNSGLIAAVKKNDFDLVNFFIWKGGSCWNEGLLIAAEKGHLDMIDLMIRYGADDFFGASKTAFKNGHHAISDNILITYTYI